MRRHSKNSERKQCKYVHDSSKVAVCTRWLQGRCEDAACPLQHAQRPELMPICSFFLQVALLLPLCKLGLQPLTYVLGQ